jgi:STAS domain
MLSGSSLTAAGSSVSSRPRHRPPPESGRLPQRAAAGPEIIVDLAGVVFIDSSGVAALVRALKEPRHAGVACC